MSKWSNQSNGINDATLFTVVVTYKRFETTFQWYRGANEHSIWTSHGSDGFPGFPAFRMAVSHFCHLKAGYHHLRSLRTSRTGMSRYLQTQGTTNWPSNVGVRQPSKWISPSGIVAVQAFKMGASGMRRHKYHKTGFTSEQITCLYIIYIYYTYVSYITKQFPQCISSMHLSESRIVG
jgi:hypothetical protein